MTGTPTVSSRTVLSAYGLLVLACTAGFGAYDLRTRRVPDRGLLAFCPVSLAAPFLQWLAAQGGQGFPTAAILQNGQIFPIPAAEAAAPLPNFLLSSLAGAATGFLILLAATLASRDGMGIGGGDIKLAAVLGFIYGPSRMAAILLTASGLAAITALIMNHIDRRAGNPQVLSLPFVPFLAAGSLAVTLTAFL